MEQYILSVAVILRILPPVFAFNSDLNTLVILEALSHNNNSFELLLH